MPHHDIVLGQIPIGQSITGIERDGKLWVRTSMFIDPKDGTVILRLHDYRETQHLEDNSLRGRIRRWLRLSHMHKADA